MSDLSPLIKIDHVCAGYNGSMVLKDINLEVFPQDFIGIIGPNGGGKTTLIKVIMGLLPLQSGQILFPGLPHGIRSIGYLPQISSFDPQFPIVVRDVILSGLMGQKKMWEKNTHNDREKAHQLIEKTGLSKLSGKTIGELSGGERQRVLLCRAMVHDPQILVLDEPNNFVDKNFEGELYDTLKELNKEIAIVLVSHDVGTISSVVKSIACVNGTLHFHPSGKISEEVLQQYNCPVELVTHGSVPHRVLKTHN